MAKRIGEDLERLIITKYVDEKKPMTAIAEELGISTCTVHDRLHKNNVAIRPQVTEETTNYDTK